MEREKLFSVLPMSQRLSLESGETYTGTITVANPAKATEDFSYLVTVTPYSVIGSSYEADLTTQNIYTDLAKWITIENPRGTIKPNETAEVKYTVRVPEGIHGGGQYATIMVSSDPDVEAAEGISVTNLFQLASVIYADVSGEIKREGEVTTNEIPDVVFGGPLTLGATIVNSGNIHQDAIFNIEVTNAWTGEVIASYDSDAEETEATGDDDSEVATSNGEFAEIVMPETTRYVTHEIEGLPLVGVVKVNQTVYFNDTPYTAEKELLVCPVWLIFIIFFVLASAIIGIITGVRRRRKKRAERAS